MRFGERFPDFWGSPTFGRVSPRCLGLGWGPRVPLFSAPDIELLETPLNFPNFPVLRLSCCGGTGDRKVGAPQKKTPASGSRVGMPQFPPPPPPPHPHLSRDQRFRNCSLKDTSFLGSISQAAPPSPRAGRDFLFASFFFFFSNLGLSGVPLGRANPAPFSWWAWWCWPAPYHPPSPWNLYWR